MKTKEEIVEALGVSEEEATLVYNLITNLRRTAIIQEASSCGRTDRPCCGGGCRR